MPAAVAEEAVRDLLQRTVMVLTHGEDVGEHLRVPLVGKPVPHRPPA